MERAYTVWNWIKYDYSKDVNKKDWQNWSEFPKRDYEIACRTMADLGYKNIECFYFLADFYKDADDEFQALMKEHGLTLVCLYNYLTNDFEADLESVQKSVDFLNRHGVPGKKHMNLESPKRPTNRAVTEEDLAKASKEADVVGKLCRENGIVLTLHPHYGTVVEQRGEIDYFAAHTDPQYVSFCLDTAHTVICGMKPEELFVTYADRLKYVHLKDVQPDPDQEYVLPTVRFRALGQGTIDFVTILKYIRQRKYDGILCVELDNPKVNHYQGAQYSRDYLHYVLGID
ncbi:MAG: sugar phosphate isomerase/epimerase [Synergistaceae bacterium]|jgi:inosose dehydratase|nr:sugar phosphate isomerase/epimerase [Synergistaceae bacterium]